MRFPGSQQSVSGGVRNVLLEYPRYAPTDVRYNFPGVFVKASRVPAVKSRECYTGLESRNRLPEGNWYESHEHQDGWAAGTKPSKKRIQLQRKKVSGPPTHNLEYSELRRANISALSSFNKLLPMLFYCLLLPQNITILLFLLNTNTVLSLFTVITPPPCLLNTSTIYFVRRFLLIVFEKRLIVLKYCHFSSIPKLLSRMILC